MDQVTCYNCDTVINIDDGPVYVGCDTIDGQYVEYDAVTCPNCGCENKG